MKVELHINGRLNVELVPETPIEKMVLSEMHEAAARWQSVKIEGSGESILVSVEK